jgi:hypothetical protein
VWTLSVSGNEATLQLAAQRNPPSR